MKTVTYSVVVPVYNSVNSLEELCKSIVGALQAYSFEIIFVNDGSKDKSWAVIEGLKQAYPDVIRAINLRKNYGQHAALLCAFGFCKGDFIITIDDDLQHDPQDILKLIEEQKKYNAEVVYASIPQKQHSAIRNAGSRYMQLTSPLVYGKSGKGSSFRLISKNVIDAIITNHKYNFVYIDEIIQWYTESIVFVQVGHYQRREGKSGYNMFKLLKMYLDILTNYSAFPLKLMTYLGGILSLATFIGGIIFLHRKMVHRVPVGYTSIIVAILFSTSVIMFCLGVISQYLFRIFLAQQNKPLYTIRQII